MAPAGNESKHVQSPVKFAWRTWCITSINLHHYERSTLQFHGAVKSISSRNGIRFSEFGVN